MSNRPSPARKHTPRSEKARQDTLDAGMSVKINDTVYTLRLGDVDGLTERRIRRETGMAVAEITQKMVEAPGIDLVAFFMFACELTSGLDPDLDAILGSVSYATAVDVVTEADEAEQVPQA